MTDLLKTAADWKQKTRHENCTQDVLLGGVSLKATFSGSEAYTEQGGDKVGVRYFNFIFRTKDIIDNGISLVRGLELLYNNESYELAYNKRVLTYYDDPFQLDIVLQMVKR